MSFTKVVITSQKEGDIKTAWKQELKKRKKKTSQNNLLGKEKRAKSRNSLL